MSVRPQTSAANKNTGWESRNRLKPAARMATSSLSSESRPKAVIEAMMPAMGRVSTRNEGSKWAKTFNTDRKPMPFVTSSSTRRSSSFVSITKHSAPKLMQNGESNSRKM